ncbi:DUF6274 family protein [Streptomyces sp. NPDC127084]|uniref:DUF6274 family protein n=1 Tax=Streptomyces sp. NPDC127084 TaxID=3347133 RepID=UPI003663FE23
MAASTVRHETRALLRAHLAAVSGYRHLTRHCPVCHRLLRLAMEPTEPAEPTGSTAASAAESSRGSTAPTEPPESDGGTSEDEHGDPRTM